MKVATGCVVKGQVVTRARLREGARVRIIEEDDLPRVVLDPDEEAGMLKGLSEFEEGKGMPIARLQKKLRQRYR